MICLQSMHNRRAVRALFVKSSAWHFRHVSEHVLLRLYPLRPPSIARWDTQITTAADISSLQLSPVAFVLSSHTIVFCPFEPTG